MIKDTSQHILTIEALKNVKILCEDEQKKVGWVQIDKGLTKRCKQFFGFHPDCLPNNNIEVVCHSDHDVIPFFDGNQYEFSNLPEEFRGLVRICSQLK